jgi:hypothetical protein
MMSPVSPVEVELLGEAVAPRQSNDVHRSVVQFAFAEQLGDRSFLPVVDQRVFDAGIVTNGGRRGTGRAQHHAGVGIPLPRRTVVALHVTVRARLVADELEPGPGERHRGIAVARKVVLGVRAVRIHQVVDGIDGRAAADRIDKAVYNVVDGLCDGTVARENQRDKE